MRAVRGNKQVVMEYTTKEKRAYVMGENKYDIVYSVRIETIEKREGYNVIGCRIFNDSILIASGLECKRKNQKQLDKLTSELTTENFKMGLEYLKQNIINMSHNGLDQEDKDNIDLIDRLLNNEKLEENIEY